MYSTPHLVSDTFPPSQVVPGGGAIYIYIGPADKHVFADWPLKTGEIGTLL